MEEFCIIIFVSLFASNSLDKAESVKVKLEETPLKTFDEIFGEGWWDKGEAAEDLKMPAPIVHHQIDRQNTQIGQIEHNSTDQIQQIEHISTDQNPPPTESDKRKIIDKFHAMRNESELTRAGLKNFYPNHIDETAAKELGFNFRTIYNWKRKLGQTAPKHKYSHSEQKELMKQYYEIKDKNPKMNVGDIAKMLNIGRTTLVRWKKQVKRQQLDPNSVDGHEENAAATVQEIDDLNSGNI
uniref:Transposase n=1 Tax=Globodera rostochiensis TaxID=31243 RepID=A0A914HNE0_GLORO